MSANATGTGAVAHLHVHSEYSLLDGANKIDAMAARAAELGMPALGLTDHGVMNGPVELFKACGEHGIKPIMGVEAYLVDDVAQIKQKTKWERNHLTLLAANRDRLRQPRQAQLGRLPRGLRARQGERRPGDAGAPLGGRDRAHRLPAVALLPPDRRGPPRRGPRPRRRPASRSSGAENVYFEVQVNGIPEQDKANEGIVRMAREMGTPLVGTADVHYLRREDYTNHAALLCVQTKSTLEQPKLRFDTNEFYLKDRGGDGGVVRALAGGGARTRSRSPSRCDVEIELGQLLLPRFPTPDGSEPEVMLRRLAEEGLRRRYGDPAPAEAVERLEMELGVIEDMGFPSYFLIVWDFVRYAKDNGVAVGPGRGSAAGSIVAYSLGITDLDPLANDLLFERFLNPARRSMPDIDIDFSVRGRERVIRYVGEKYGRESVAQIITFGTMAPRAATRDAARVLGYDYGTGDRVAKLIPEPIMGRSPSFDECLKGGDLKKAYDAEQDVRQIVDTARGLEGIVRNNSIHAAAVVIADRPLQEVVPLQLAEDRGAAQGRRALLQDRDPVLDGPGRGDRAAEDGLPRPAQPRRDRGRGRDHRALPRRRARRRGAAARRRPKTYEMLARGDSIGVFQLESEGMREAMRKVQADRVRRHRRARLALPPRGDALHRRLRPRQARPRLGPLPGRAPAPDHRGDLRLLHLPGAADGDLQADRAASAGAEADDLRKAIGKKKRDLMATMEAKFIDGLRRLGHRRQRVAKDLWSLMTAAADYSFNKSHAACYALIAYRTAYLKANYPAEYMAAVISSVMSTKDKVPFFVNRCEEMGIEVLPPDVNVSDHGFVVSGNNIRFGLDAVKNVGHAAVEAIIEAREERPFESLWDFCERVDCRAVNKRAIECLIKCGALDSTGRRPQGDARGAAAGAVGRPEVAGGRAARPGLDLRARRRLDGRRRRAGLPLPAPADPRRGVRAARAADDGEGDARARSSPTIRSRRSATRCACGPTARSPSSRRSPTAPG